MQRRRERRYEVWESVVLTLLEEPERHSAATVIDISPSGYRLLSAAELPAGKAVLITLNSVAIVGRVCHCEPAENGAFTAGVEITEVNGGVAAPMDAVAVYA
jgi:hypothetical protein